MEVVLCLVYCCPVQPFPPARERFVSPASPLSALWLQPKMKLVSTSTLHKWKSQLKEAGSLSQRNAAKPGKKELSKLKKCVEKNPDMYL